MTVKKIIGLLFFLIAVSTNLTSGQYKDKIAFFAPKDFPTFDSKVIDENKLKLITADFNVDFFHDVGSLNKNLTTAKYKLLVLPFGSAFPLDCWNAVLNFLNSGGSLLSIGGSPFHQPVIWKDSVWVAGIPQQTFARQLLIGPSEKIHLYSSDFYKPIKYETLNEFIIDKNDITNINSVFEGTFRFTTQKDFDDQDGSSGPRSAILRPLLHLINKDGFPIAAPIIEIDRLQGSNAGGRWMFIQCDGNISAELIKKLMSRTLEGAVEFTAVPVFASLNKLENPLIRINLFRPSENSTQSVEVKIFVKNSEGKIIHSENIFLHGLKEYKTVTAQLNISDKLRPGFYSVEVEAQNVNWHPAKTKTGFWIWDSKLANSAPKLKVSKDWLQKNGEPFPIIGTTYMASDVHRKFLFEPNPSVWQNDFAMMKKSGINFLRTGLWNSWSRAMLDRGAIDESFLRSLDAFVLTALQHDIILCFNFFAFSPPLNGGTNPYLDPRALDWQKTFITLIASRYKNISSVHFDLINEPSYSPYNDLWKNIPIGDEYERSAWKKWIEEKYSNKISEIQNLWRDSKGDIYSPPVESELSYRIYKEDRRPRKALEFNLFTQEVVKNWADELTKTIKQVNGSLVTLGQDEGGTSNRPAQQFHYSVVDYTSIHTWWNNDDLLWDGLMTKVPEKPSLISETGLMRLEDIDGELWRSPEKALQLLDRKFALGFASRGAGIVQWAWNINPYMPIDNESLIGFFRPDGTAKLEIEILKKYSKFFNSALGNIKDYEPSPVIVVIPHTKIFSGRKIGDLSTKRLVRLMSDYFAITPTLMSEYQLADERLKDAKLVIIPSVEYLDDSAAVTLYRASLKGTNIIFTGSLEGNAFGELSSAITKLGLKNSAVPVSLYESYFSPDTNNSKIATITFDNQQSEFIKKSTAHRFYSNGNIFHEPLPVETAKEKEPLIDLLKYIFEISRINYQYYDEPLATSVFNTDKNIFLFCVNESSKDIFRDLKVFCEKAIEIIIPVKVAAGFSKIFLLDRVSGKIISQSD